MNDVKTQGAAGATSPKPLAPGRPRVAAIEEASSLQTPRARVDRRAAGRLSEHPGLEAPASDPAATAAEAVASSDASIGSSLEAQVSYLQRTSKGLNLATASVCLLLAVLWSAQSSSAVLAPWLALGAVSVALRYGLVWGYRPVAGRELPTDRARRFLTLATIAAVPSGLMMGWGWMHAVALEGPGQREVYLIAQFVLMLWTLHAFKPFPPAVLGFVIASVGPAMAATTGMVGDRAPAPGTTLSLAILSLVVMGFALRSAQEFHAALRLQQRVQRLLEEVTAKRDEAVLATQAKSRFLASVSHDLRQPMHAMNLYLSAVTGQFDRLRASPGEPTAARGVQEGLRSLQHSMLYLNSMFESLLDISRLNAGTVEVNIRHTTVLSMLSQLESDYRRQAASQGLRFEMRLPAQIQIMEVKTDPAMLERLLRNLLVNAFRYTRAGGVRLSLKVRGHVLDFRVVDTGPGIERSMRTRVFEEFFQVPEATPQRRPSEGPSEPGSDAARSDAAATDAPVAGRGIGLGLSISTRLADKLGSRIRLHSHVGHGSVFAFRQPVRFALRPQGDDRPTPPESPVGLPSDLFVAVVEDDAVIRLATQQMLEMMGTQVYVAEGALQAVQQLGRLGRRPDFLICDYRLGDENGIQAIAMLREEFNHDIPALLITGDTSPEQVEEFRRAGLTVLYKPVSANAMLLAMRAQLSGAAWRTARE